MKMSKVSNDHMSPIPPQPGLFGPMDNVPPTTISAAQAGSLVTVALDAGVDNLFDYAVPKELEAQLRLGQRVRVPFGKGNRSQIGFCVAFPQRSSMDRLKVVAEVVDPAPLIDPQMMQLAQWIAQYYCCRLGTVLAAMVPAAVKRRVGMAKKTYVRLTEKSTTYPKGLDGVRLSAKGRAIIELLHQRAATNDGELLLDELAAALQCTKAPFRTLDRLGLLQITQRQELPSPQITAPPPHLTTQDIKLNEDQANVLAAIEKLIDQQTFNAILLYGVTGSGKTELYYRCIEKVLATGTQALVLVPEIALTTQLVSRFLHRFERVAVLHSALTQTKRHQQWRWIAQGGPQVVVGARSAVFAPLPKLGLIVVDEEHEPSYKQDAAPRYHARDVAIKRAQMNAIPIILGSATPSLESLHNCHTRNHYHLLRLPKRVLNLPLPPVTPVNMRTEATERKGTHLLSRMLEGQLHNCLQQKRQAILLLNRRGHSSYLFCPSCQFILTCPNCDVNLTHHRRRSDFQADRRSWVMCHHCLYRSELPRSCPVCRTQVRLIGPGTQRLEDELHRKFPQARFYRVDTDSMRPGRYEQVLADFATRRIDFLLGTQMIGKGLDFPNVSLVGVINADTALSLPDFRSSERTFQLITQVAGRCGRAQSDGRVIVQTFVPEEPTLKLAYQHDYTRFAEHELAHRRQCLMPPYHRLARILLADRSLQKVETAAQLLRRHIDKFLSQLNFDLQVRGPIPAVIARRENLHRQEILLKGPNVDHLQQLLAHLRHGPLKESAVQTIVDVDPINLV